MYASLSKRIEGRLTPPFLALQLPRLFRAVCIPPGSLKGFTLHLERASAIQCHITILTLQTTQHLQPLPSTLGKFSKLQTLRLEYVGTKSEPPTTGNLYKGFSLNTPESLTSLHLLNHSVSYRDVLEILKSRTLVKLLMRGCDGPSGPLETEIENEFTTLQTSNIVDLTVEVPDTAFDFFDEPVMLPLTRIRRLRLIRRRDDMPLHSPVTLAIYDKLEILDTDLFFLRQLCAPV